MENKLKLISVVLFTVFTLFTLSSLFTLLAIFLKVFC